MCGGGRSGQRHFPGGRSTGKRCRLSCHSGQGRAMDLAVLFLSAFGAATILPMSSEVVLGARVLAGTSNLCLLLAVATAGNTLGAVVNWGLGRYAARWRTRLVALDEAKFECACRWFQRWGIWCLLLSCRRPRPARHARAGCRAPRPPPPPAPASSFSLALASAGRGETPAAAAPDPCCQPTPPRPGQDPTHPSASRRMRFALSARRTAVSLTPRCRASSRLLLVCMA
jgi:hypothetical protein